MVVSARDVWRERDSDLPVEAGRAAKTSADIDELQKENDLYMQQIRSLQNDPKAIEKEAREQLHYARPGEVVYVPPVADRPANNAARK